MVVKLQLLALLVLHSTAVLSRSSSLLDVLRKEGFTEFASLLEGPDGFDVANAGPDLIVYAPTNAAFAGIAASNCTSRLVRRDDVKKASGKQHVAKSRFGGDKRRATITTVPGAEALMTLLDDPTYVNLGPGQNSSIVQKNVPNAGLPTVLTGGGAVVKVTALDIKFDGGVIRPISGVFTLPASLSQTLPLLGTDKTLAALQRSGLLAELDNRTGITFLAPDDAAIKDLSDDQLVQALRQHIIVGLPAYTPLLENGGKYSTLAGTTVTVSVQGPDFFIGGARILAGDAIIKNGVVHTVDRLISAPSGTTSATATGAAPTSPIVTGAAGSTKPMTVVTAGLGMLAVAGYILF